MTTMVIQNNGFLTYGGELRLTFDLAVANTGASFSVFNLGTGVVPTGSFAAVNIYTSISSPVLVGSLVNNSGVWTGTYDLGFGGGSQSFQFTEATGLLVIPEPSTWALVGLGIGFTLFRIRGRNRRHDR